MTREVAIHVMHCLYDYYTGDGIDSFYSFSERDKEALSMAITDMERVAELEATEEKCNAILSSLSENIDATMKDFFAKFEKLEAENKRLKEGIAEFKEAIEDEGAFEQETKGKTEFLRGIDYCLGILNRDLSEVTSSKDVDADRMINEDEVER